MEENTKIRLIIGGLVLVGFAVGYLILAQRFQTETPKIAPQPMKNIIASPSATPTPVVINQGSDNQTDGLNTLPQTGVPLPILASFALSAIVSGFFLRKFPN